MAEAVLDRLGTMPYALIGDGLRMGELIMMLIGLIGGGAGLFFWRRVKAVTIR